MKTFRIVSGFILFLLISGCAQDPRMESSVANATFEQELNAEVPQSIISSSAAVETNNDDKRRFIRTADLKFKVKNVIKSTYNIEKITANHGGFVTSTNLTSSKNGVTTTAISADSLLETTYYTISNTLTLRVPNAKLDTTLKDISGNIDFLDYRIIKANDVALQLMANELTQKRNAKNEQRLTNAIDNRGKKLKETTSAEELLLRKQEQSDEAKIANLALEDQISFSTINLIIYQRPSIKREIISNNKNIEEYKPGIGSRMLEAVKMGWFILEAIVLFIINIWSLLVIAVICFLAVRWFRKRRRNH